MLKLGLQKERFLKKGNIKIHDVHRGTDKKVCIFYYCKVNKLPMVKKNEEAWAQTTEQEKQETLDMMTYLVLCKVGHVN